MAVTAHHFRSIGLLGGFPYSAPSDSVEDRYFPAGMSPGQMAKWYWRVKLWNVTFNMSASAAGRTAAYNDGTHTGTTATQELDLALGSPCSITFAGTPGAGLVFGDGGCLMFQGDGGQYRFNGGTGLYEPTISISGSLAAFDDEEPTVDSALLSFTTDPSIYGESEYEETTASIDGISFPLYYQETLTGDGSTVHSGITITPAEYWAYAAADGSPIYSTGTGAQLQSPLN